MKTLSPVETSGVQKLLRWGESLGSRAAAAIKPKHRADWIAALVATSNNPAGA
jgi:hypothetical protein